MKPQKIGNHRGTSRLWLQGAELAEAGWTKGVKFTFGIDGTSVVLIKDPDGCRIVSGKTVRRKNGETAVPIIDINSKHLPFAPGSRVHVEVFATTIRVSRV